MPGGGLGLMPDATTVARVAREATGETPGEVRPLGRGMTCVAWAVEAGRREFVVLVEIPPDGRDALHRDTPANLAARHAIHLALHEADPAAPIPESVACSATIDRDPLGGRWSWQVLSLVTGEPLDAARHPEAVRDLGRLLARLHTLPVEGQGLLEDRADAIYGRAATPTESILSRWGQQWPYDGRALLAHPIARHAPDLVGTLGELREPLLRYAGPWVQAGLCHTDLCGPHALVRDGRLTALMDFGDAAIVPVAFDLASFAYYHAAHRGWDALHTLLEGYEPHRVIRDVREAEAYQLLVVLVLQKVRKRTASGESALLGEAIDVLRAALPRAMRRDA
ncbi:MAG: aminoglycoside phosphotransferase family protein [Chloroflexi bacterium]|nr:aminoglycoside phosphotransferase family protein [Chloroflexota bacterium]